MGKRQNQPQESQGARPLPAGDHTAAKNRQESMTDTKHILQKHTK